jgi:uncharacterized pyridoxamine 5'-phosphate oxidase family protein/NAD-dependent dihydropyrimidine dehydrogenase PreA subunit
MDLQTCFQKLQLVGVLSFATVDQDGNPQLRNISAIHFEEDSFYFYTARGKNFCQELLNDGRLQILGYTRYKEMIRVSAKAMPVPESEQKKWIDIIFDEQPYLANVYPGSTREIGMIFKVDSGSVEYFNLGVYPIFRETYTFGDAVAKEKGFVITNACIGCGTCQTVCPQQCIDAGNPYFIRPNNCLHCGNCYEHCPAKAIKHLYAVGIVTA